MNHIDDFHNSMLCTKLNFSDTIFILSEPLDNFVGENSQ